MHLVGGVAFYEADPGDEVNSVLKLLSTWKNYDVSKVEILSPKSPKYGFQDCPLAMVWHNGRVHLVVRRIIEESKGGKVSTEETKKECVEETCTYEKTLLVLPIYNAYLRKTCYDSEQALRLTFIEVQRYMGRALTWPNK